MGCLSDNYDGSSTLRNPEHDLAWFKAALCGALVALERSVAIIDHVAYSNDPYDFINYKEAGILRKDVVSWHTAHKEQDRIRREREAAIQRKKELRISALAKLSPEEREVLGLSDDDKISAWAS